MPAAIQAIASPGDAHSGACQGGTGGGERSRRGNGGRRLGNVKRKWSNIKLKKNVNASSLAGWSLVLV
jgi:hypothetical protein